MMASQALLSNEILARKVLKMSSADERGPVRWPEIPVEGLDCEKDRGPVRWPEIPVEGLDCKASPALHWGRSS